jgi:hypothetical protein
LVRHANGGGCTPASVPASVYVGPYATILAGANVSGNVRIEDEATVVNGTVTGGTIGALSLIGGNNQPYNAGAFSVSGTPVIRTTFYPLAFYENPQSVSGTATLYGDVEYRGANKTETSGNWTGIVDDAAVSTSTADVTVKGPYSWRP